MATDSYSTSQNEDSTAGLERELRLRPINGGGLPSGTSTAPTRGWSQERSLADTLRQAATHLSGSSPRNHVSPSTGVVGSTCCPAHQSASSDSSGDQRNLLDREKGKGLATMGSTNNFNLGNTATGRSLFSRGGPGSHCDDRSSVIGEQDGRDMTLNSAKQSTATAGALRKKHYGLSAISGKMIFKGPKPKRQRPSRKRPTLIFQASPAEFIAKVQELTGLTLPVVLERVFKVPADQAAGEAGSPSMPARISSISNPSPAVTVRVPEPAFSSAGSAASSSSKSSLNYCMGYEQPQFPFPDQQPRKEQLPEDSGIPDDDFQSASDSLSYGYIRKVGMQNSSHKANEIAAAVPLVSEGVDEREGITREGKSPGSAMPDDFTTLSPSEFLVPRNRPRDFAVDEVMEYFMDPDFLEFRGY